MENNKCTGLVGMLVGHSFVHVFNTTRIPIDPATYERMVKSAKAYNFWNTFNEITTDNIPKEKVIKVYQHSMCKRCGLIKSKTEKK